VIDRENKRKLVRALEVTKLTGKPFSQSQAKGESKYDVLQIGILVDREVLNERINLRVDEMVAKGLVDEVRKLKDQYGCEIESMTSIGYRQVCEFLEKKVSLKEAIEEVKTASRQYAKRQMTWFKRDERIQWVETQPQAIALAETFFKQKTHSL
jgi:tRNA dimethylallyltransferase